MKLLINLVALLAVANARLDADGAQRRELEAIGDAFVQALDDKAAGRGLEWGGMGDWGGKGWGTDFNMTEIMEKLQNVNFTDIYDRCCPSNTTVMDGTTQYDSTDGESCNCPVRSNATFATKWDDSCTNKLGPKVISGETFDMEKFMEIMEKFMNANFTDIYDRCCPSPNGTNTYDADPSACNCPVRNSTEYMEKWEYKCENKYAVKAAGGDYDKEGFDFNAMIKNHTAVYMNCCPSMEGLPKTLYDDNMEACSCPVRQDEKFAEKWTTQCEEEYGPKAMEEMEMLPTPVGAEMAQTSSTSSAAASLKGAWWMSSLVAAIAGSVVALH